MAASASGRHALLYTALAALGVVYGDIGTSPLYALRECFHGPHALPLTPANVLGVLSLIFWSLIIVVSIKYLLWVMRADNRGEGGILALLALACPQQQGKSARRNFLLTIGLFGTALMYGDGMITPAVTVLGAVEGLSVVTEVFKPYVVVISSVIIIGLFVVQQHGTAKIGAFFGPVTLVWFMVLAGLGAASIVQHPQVLHAVNPWHAAEFMMQNRWSGFVALGSIFLVVTGGEALYADMGHFGLKPIRLAWFWVALPSLIINYFGQGALLLVTPAAAENPFFHLAPSWAVAPLVVLATIAAAIASQAVISGAFSITRQAIQLGYMPRLEILHTSSLEIGQIYVPKVNLALLVATLWLVWSFKSSSALAAAYGIAVCSTMIITTVLACVVARQNWKWSLPSVGVLLCFFGVIDLAFFGANALKIFQGGWFPLLVGGIIFVCMITWRKGRRIVGLRLRAKSRSFENFVREAAGKYARVPGTAVFMTSDGEGTPPALLHNVRHNKVLHERVISLTMQTEEISHVLPEESISIQEVAKGFYRLKARFGFMDEPTVQAVFTRCQEKGFDFSLADMTFFLGRETILATEKPGMAIWREKLFSFMSRNAQRANVFFGIPPQQVIEVGVQVEL